MTKTKDRLFRRQNPRLWRRPVEGVNRARERLSERRLALPQEVRRTVIAMFDQALLRFLAGYASHFGMPQARRWRFRLRLRQNRP